MKYLPLQLLFAALILVCGIYSYCGPKPMTNVPDYENIMADKPKKIIGVYNPHGICVADNGIFAVVSDRYLGYFRIYYGSGEQMKQVRVPSGYRNLTDCTFAGDNLYVTGTNKKIYKYSMDGRFKKVVARGEQYTYMTSCGNDMLYVTAGKSLIAYHNDKEEWRVEVPTGEARRPIISLDNKIHLSTLSNKVLLYSLKGKALGNIEYEGLKSGDGIAIDATGNTLIVARKGSQKLLVYSPCGKLIKTMKFHTPADVAIGNDGTMIVADFTKHQVFMY